MKKLLVALLVAVLCVPAMADVTVSLADNADGSFNILLDTDGDGVRGLALKVVSAGSGLVIADSSFAGFNTCIDWAYSNGGYDNVGDGHPFAADGAAGVAVDGATTFVVSMGYLDQTENQLPFSSTDPVVIATVEVGAGEVCVTEDTLRGGIVGDAALTVVMPAECLTVTDGPGECMMASHPDYSRWEQFGKPDAWCYEYQCRGDADGKLQGSVFTGYYPVGPDDLAVMLAAYTVLEANIGTIEVNGVPGIAADFDHASQGSVFTGYYPVGPDDLAILLNFYTDLVATVTPCDDTHINFWITP